MASMKRGVRIASMLVLIAVIASGCRFQYSTPPAVTSTPIGGGSLFANTLEPASMTEVQGFATQTALALSGTPNASQLTFLQKLTCTPSAVAGNLYPAAVSCRSSPQQ